jgi:hypothetical protein
MGAGPDLPKFLVASTTRTLRARDRRNTFGKACYTALESRGVAVVLNFCLIAAATLIWYYIFLGLALKTATNRRLSLAEPSLSDHVVVYSVYILKMVQFVRSALQMVGIIILLRRFISAQRQEHNILELQRTSITVDTTLPRLCRQTYDEGVFLVRQQRLCIEVDNSPITDGRSPTSSIWSVRS